MLLVAPLRDLVPSALRAVSFFGHEAWQWGALVVAAVLAYPVGRFVAFIVGTVALFFARRTKPPLDDALVLVARRPLRLGLAAVFFGEVATELELVNSLAKVVGHVRFTLLLIAFAWFLSGALRALAEWAEARAETKGDEVSTRAFRTQLILLERVGTAAIVIVSLAMFLLQFEVVKNVGISLLASAGIVGIVLGLAAQKTIGAVIAGVQLSITQPIRIGDTVFVDKDWGDIEEINLTYVVVKLWDGRRQVIPIGRFLDQPFENWTKADTKLVGAVLLPVDYMAPIGRLRTELAQICKDNENWDGRVAELRVADASENTMTLRATVSAANPDAAAALRLDVREGLLTFLRELDGGAYLPRRRIEGAPPTGDAHRS